MPQPQLQFAHSDSESSAGYIAATSASEANAADNAAAVIVDPGPEVVDAWRSEAGVAGDNRPSEKTEVHCLEGQLDRTYLFATDGDGLILIDQHAAHERVIFDRLMQTLRPDNSQLLVIPETMELNYRQYKMASEKIPVFKSLGYDLEPFGGKTIVIRAVPVIRGISDHKPLLLDLIEQLLATERFNNPKEIQEAFLITMSCRAAVKAGDRLANLEKEQLLSDLWKTRNPYTCPHGRPTMIRLSRDELDRRFRRK
ncbi:MAG TPA: hypothetical protein DF292_03685 [Firmicutes bacterium]|nr:hypothetical protein [Bacillota bacterium]